MSRRLRNPRGSMLLLVLCIIAFVFVPLYVLVGRLAPFCLSAGKVQNVVDAAGLLAANELSQVVINDPHFGFVSLSDHQATGSATQAKDGQPLPVLGINTLVGTVRQTAIIADSLHNLHMSSLVNQDAAFMQATVGRLNSSLSNQLSGNLSAFDQNGAPVNTLADVRTFLQQNLPSNMKLESVSLTLGWLDGPSESSVPLPRPEQMARLDGQETENNQYLAFRPYPVGKQSFTFAGLGPQAHLVSAKLFQPVDESHICSIVKLDCSIISTDQTHSRLLYSVCGQAYSKPDTAIPGAMTVRFAESPVAGVLSWNELLSGGNFSDRQLTGFNVIRGDYPFQKTAQMRVNKSSPHSTSSQQFAESLYYWLRNGHLRPNISKLIAALNEPFMGGPNQVYIFQFAEDGNVTRNVLPADQFPRAVVAQGQTAILADTKIRSGAGAIVFFRNNVANLSTTASKHAGQPLAGYPLHSVGKDLNYEELANNFPKRNGQKQSLALDIEIGGLSRPHPQDDIISMRRKTASRRI